MSDAELKKLIEDGEWDLVRELFAKLEAQYKAARSELREIAAVFCESGYAYYKQLQDAGFERVVDIARESLLKLVAERDVLWAKLEEKDERPSLLRLYGWSPSFTANSQPPISGDDPSKRIELASGWEQKYVDALRNLRPLLSRSKASRRVIDLYRQYRLPEELGPDPKLWELAIRLHAQALAEVSGDLTKEEDLYRASFVGIHALDAVYVRPPAVGIYGKPVPGSPNDWTLPDRLSVDPRVINLTPGQICPRCKRTFLEIERWLLTGRRVGSADGIQRTVNLEHVCEDMDAASTLDASTRCPKCGEETNHVPGGILCRG